MPSVSLGIPEIYGTTVPTPAPQTPKRRKLSRNSGCSCGNLDRGGSGCQFCIAIMCVIERLETTPRVTCNRLSFGPLINSQIMTQRLINSYKCSALSYAYPASSHNLY